MKILEISSTPITFPGGGEKIILELCKELSKRHEVTVLQTDLYQEKKNIPAIAKIGKIKVITTKNKMFCGGFGYSPSFAQELRRIYKDFDLVHVHGYGRYTTHFSLKFLRGKKPLVYTAHGFFHHANLIKRAYDFFFKTLVNNASRLVALTELDLLQFEIRKVDGKKITLIPNFIDLSRFRKTIRSKKKFLKKIGVDDSKKILLYVGRIHESKGIQYVMESIKGLNLNFLIVGNDVGYLPTLKNLAKKRGIEKKVFYFQGVNDKMLSNFYAVSDFFVLFSEWEGFGITVIEAMASGLPVIVSDRGALPFLVKNGQNGLIVKFRDMPGLKNSIKSLMEDDSLAERLSENSIDFANNFDIKKVVKSLEMLYSEEIKRFNQKANYLSA